MLVKKEGEGGRGGRRARGVRGGRKGNYTGGTVGGKFYNCART